MAVSLGSCSNVMSSGMKLCFIAARAGMSCRVAWQQLETAHAPQVDRVGASLKLHAVAGLVDCGSSSWLFAQCKRRYGVEYEGGEGRDGDLSLLRTCRVAFNDRKEVAQTLQLVGAQDILCYLV